MKRMMSLLLGLVVAFSLGACDSDDDDGGGGSGGSAAGTWTGTGNYVFNSVPITAFTMNLTQSGNAISGTYSITRDARPTMTGSLSGTVNGSSITLTMPAHGYANGTFGGNSMTLNWTETGFGGTDFAGPQNATVALSR
jgi:hypothetical protein